jgi:hypothetical protein
MSDDHRLSPDDEIAQPRRRCTDRKLRYAVALPPARLPEDPDELAAIPMAQRQSATLDWLADQLTEDVLGSMSDMGDDADDLAAVEDGTRKLLRGFYDVMIANRDTISAQSGMLAITHYLREFVCQCFGPETPMISWPMLKILTDHANTHSNQLMATTNGLRSMLGRITSVTGTGPDTPTPDTEVN